MNQHVTKTRKRAARAAAEPLPTTFAALVQRYKEERAAWQAIPPGTTTNDEDNDLADRTYEATEKLFAATPIVDAADYLAGLDILESASRALVDDADALGAYFMPETVLGIIDHLRAYQPSTGRPITDLGTSAFAAAVNRWKEARDTLNRRATTSEEFDEDAEYAKIVALETEFLAKPILTNEDYAAAIALVQADHRDLRPGDHEDEHLPTDAGMVTLLEKLATVRLTPIDAEPKALRALLAFEPHIYDIGHRSRLLLDGFIEDRIKVDDLYPGYFCLVDDIDTLAATLHTTWDAAVAQAQGRS
jgi:hypothetical protein